MSILLRSRHLGSVCGLGCWAHVGTLRTQPLVSVLNKPLSSFCIPAPASQVLWPAQTAECCVRCLQITFSKPLNLHPEGSKDMIGLLCR